MNNETAFNGSQTEQSERFYFSKLHSDMFDETSWKLVLSYPQPIPAFACQIYLTIVTESTKCKGILLRSDKKAYTREQLMLLCRLNYTDEANTKHWNMAFDALIAEEILKIREDGAIIVCLAEELWGSESKSARKMRKYRKRKLSLLEDEINENAGSESQEGHIVTDNVTESDTFGNEPTTNEISPKLNDSFLNPSKSNRDLETAGTNVPAAAADFVEIYPKKTSTARIIPLMEKMTEAEIEALLIAARRVASDPSKAESNGRFAVDPLKFIKSRPWSDEDLHDAEMIIRGRELSRMAEAEEGGQQ